MIANPGSPQFHSYNCVTNHIAGFFGGEGGKFSWMIRFVVIHGKKIMVGSSLNHTPHARVEQWPLVFEVKYRAIWDAQLVEQFNAGEKRVTLMVFMPLQF